VPREGIQVDTVTITFPLPDEGDVLPLSWKLSEYDKQRIDKAWSKLLGVKQCETNPITRLDKYFTPPKKRTAMRRHASE